MHRNNISTANKGIHLAINEIEKRGGRNVVLKQEGNRKYIIFTSPGGKMYKVTTRAKSKGTWQTSIEYGKPRTENKQEGEYWLFVDLEFEPPKFFIVPLWWIQNDIYLEHQKYLERHGGHRAYNDRSKHHAIPVKRIKSWENRWDEIGL